jgi:hypothetical protein
VDSSVARFPAVATVVWTSGGYFMPLGPSRSSLRVPCLLARCLTPSNCAIARYRRVADLRSEGQLGDVNGGVGSTECKVVRNKVPRSLFELCRWSVQTACD